MKARLILTVCLISVSIIRAQTSGGSRPAKNPQPDWESMLPAIREVFKNEAALDPNFGAAGTRYPAAVSKTADVTGDGVPEALIDLGIGGAYTDELTVMRLEENKPVLAVFKLRDGKISPTVFPSGASVMHGAAVDLLPQEHAVYSMHYDYAGNGKLQQCTGEAYRWNRRSQTFDYASVLTKKLTKSACSRVPKAVGP